MQATAGLTIGAMDVYYVLFAEANGMSPVLIGILIGVIYAGSLLSIYITRVANLLGKFSSMAIGHLGMIIGLLLVIVYGMHFFWVIFVGFAFQQISYMLVRPTRNGVVAALTPKDMQGEMSGIQVTIVSSANFLGAILFGYIAEYLGLVYIFVIAGFVYAVQTVVFLIMHYRYEGTIKHVKIHPHRSMLHMFHIDALPHSVPHSRNPFLQYKSGKK